MVYQSRTLGLDNRWDLWTYDKHAAVISIRGTTDQALSWMGNFYAAMVPARGYLCLAPRDSFQYNLAANPRAMVHVGWLLSMAYLSRDILPMIDSCYNAGIHEFLLMGHSQGGAINFLLTAYLLQLQQAGLLPPDIHFKTYCSAGPKPGNLYFAYDYEHMTPNGMAFNVVNAADWVPETPISIQTVRDFNSTNPFIVAPAIIRKQGFPKRYLLMHVFNRLDRPTRKAQRIYQKYLGRMSAKVIRKTLKDFAPPRYSSSSDYVRTGTTIVLMPDPSYYRLFKDDPKNIFVHHLHKPYLYLLTKYGTARQ